MRHAYLIAAHDNPAALVRLVEALRCEGARFFIHIDAAVALKPFTDALGDKPDIHWVIDRVRVTWMGWSQVEATLRMLGAAHPDAFDRYTLLSGADYPIKSNDEIARILSRDETEYLTAWRLSDRPSWQHKVQYYYPIEQIPIRNYGKAKARRVFWASFVRLRRFFPKRSMPASLEPWGGSSWWTLTHSCVSHILGVVRERPEVVRFYRTTHAPDEGFFHTLVMNSPFAERVHRRAEYERWRAETRPWERVDLPTEKARMLPDEVFNLRYVDWSEEFTHRREAPAILDERDFEALRASECFLARKFDPVRSAGLLDRIDSELRRSTPVLGAMQ
ncbi:beta-1,6-N-acetylglucosaminyltransferase [Salinarimonas soli]|uniref:beta-1,6-N-acetylglucosaminyltransferase n=1 Tax=Salinarimonas soli TaxID=1638099 RepID=UPI001661A09A|nr:beta-1,6-N-acetylglucosaminyltransferase [Salinarimonas soli]